MAFRRLKISLLTFAALALLNERTPAQGTGEYLAYFNTPTRTAGVTYPDYTILNTLLLYIYGATPGSEIRGHITSIGSSATKDLIVAGLKAAHQRGVTVYLVHNGAGALYPGSSPNGDELEAYFGTRHKYCWEEVDHGPRFRYVTSCVSTIPTATHHIKNWLFSNTLVGGRVRAYSTWVTSYNLTDTSDEQFNDLFIVNDNYDLYSAGVQSFASFYGQRRTDDFYSVPGRGHHVIRSALAEVSYSPHLATDYVAAALSRIDAAERNCALKIAVLSISSARQAIINELVRIRGMGCSVQLAFANQYGSAVSQLVAAGVKVRPAQGVGLHSKMMVYRGRYDGVPNRRMVWGGSHNWTPQSQEADEVFVAVSNTSLYESYRTYFDTLWESFKIIIVPRP